MTSEISKTSFWRMLKEYGGILRIVLSGDFVLALLIGIAVGVFVDTYTFKRFIPTMLSVSSALLSVVIAAIAILASISDPKLMLALKKEKLLRTLLFPYWLIVFSLIVSILLDSITFLFWPQWVTVGIIRSGMWRAFVFFVFLYGLFAMSYFIPNVIRVMVLRTMSDGSKSEEA